MDPITAQQQAWLDQEDRKIALQIREHGYYIEYVLGAEDEHETPFAYSVGLHGIGHPELLLFGTGPTTTITILNDLFVRVRSGDDLTPGELVSFDSWPHRLLVEPLPNPSDILFAAHRHYRIPVFEGLPGYDPIPALQLTWDDRSGRFPTDPGYSVPAWVQPRPGTFRA